MLANVVLLLARFVRALRGYLVPPETRGELSENVDPTSVRAKIFRSKDHT